MIKKQIVFNKVRYVEEIKKLAEECGISFLIAQILYDRKYRNKIAKFYHTLWQILYNAE